MEMSREEVETMCKLAAHDAVMEYDKSHPCKMTSGERGLLHALHEISEEEGANHGHWRIIVQWGVNVSDVTKSLRKSILWIILGVCALFLVWWKAK